MVYLIYTTDPDEKVGTDIARHLLEKKLIACANLLPRGQSLYLWKGTLQKEEEHVLLLKTAAHLFNPVQQELEHIHPYECPCILGLAVDQAHLPFMNWISESVATDSLSPDK